ncbi:MAG: hypothetical protein JWP85_1980 [Rhodoglobus sp.]|nr:hypothetical protein [Rhodoglobus sp.]
MARAGSASRWVSWLGGAVGFGVLLFLAGLAGMLGRPDPLAVDLGLVGAVAGGTPALDCPGGEPVAQFTPSERVFVTARTADGAYLAVRIPGKQYETVWVSAVALTSDDATAIDRLPIDECIVPVVEGPVP